VKQYLQRQWGKILSGRVSLQDFIFAKEVRLGTYSARSPVLPPAAIVASKAMAVDPRAEPRYAERIPYVVVHGEPGARLVDMVVDPLTLIEQPSLRLHDTYYITKQIIPACQRIFMLVGVDLKAWFSEMPRVYRPPVAKRVSSLAFVTRSTRWDPEAAKKKQRVGGGLKHGTIDQYYLSRHCTVCGEYTKASQLLCGACSQDPVAAILLPGRTSRLERQFKLLEAVSMSSLSLELFRLIKVRE
jgi:DNA polymerase zeta